MHAGSIWTQGIMHKDECLISFGYWISRKQIYFMWDDRDNSLKMMHNVICNDLDVRNNRAKCKLQDSRRFFAFLFTLSNEIPLNLCSTKLSLFLIWRIAVAGLYSFLLTRLNRPVSSTECSMHKLTLLKTFYHPRIFCVTALPNTHPIKTSRCPTS